jgi:extradiol dioxygenase family protein
MNLTPFHIAVVVRDVDEARHFYGKLLGFPEGRSDQDWIDFDMFGHQFVVHLDRALGADGKIEAHHNPVDGKSVPVPHCGVVLEVFEWQRFRRQVENVISDFVVAPYTRFEGEPGEQHTMFFLDPTGNALEFKAFKDIEAELFNH